MDYDTVSPEDFGAGLRGMGLNLLVRDVQAHLEFLTNLFGMAVFQPSADFAILRYGDQVFQLHSDGTFANHPLSGLLPDNPPRGTGIELRLYETDPDQAAARATELGAVVLQAPKNKPHGLREAVILDPDGYAWVPSRPLTAEDK